MIPGIICVDRHLLACVRIYAVARLRIFWVRFCVSAVKCVGMPWFRRFFPSVVGLGGQSSTRRYHSIVGGSVKADGY